VHRRTTTTTTSQDANNRRALINALIPRNYTEEDDGMYYRDDDRESDREFEGEGDRENHEASEEEAWRRGGAEKNVWGPASHLAQKIMLLRLPLHELYLPRQKPPQNQRYRMMGEEHVMIETAMGKPTRRQNALYATQPLPPSSMPAATKERAIYASIRRCHICKSTGGVGASLPTTDLTMTWVYANLHAPSAAINTRWSALSAGHALSAFGT
jgi:hypothetical protein